MVTMTVQLIRDLHRDMKYSGNGTVALTANPWTALIVSRYTLSMFICTSEM
jgi:hypothetical protein